MTGFTRRGFILGILSFGGFLGACGGSGGDPKRAYVERVLRKSFGRDMVQSKAARDFIAAQTRIQGHEIAPLVEGYWTRHLVRIGGVFGFGASRRLAKFEAAVDGLIVRNFLQYTNAFRVYHGVDDTLYFVSLDPYEVGCVNHLAGTHWDEDLEKALRRS